MKQIIAGFCVAMLVLLAACEKNTTYSPPSVNAWTFKGVTSKPYSCVFQNFVAPPQFPGNYGLASPTTTSNLDSNYAFMSIIFPDSNGVVTGTYTVANDDGIHPPAVGQVIIHLRYGPAGHSTLYYSTGAGTNQTVAVSSVSMGRLSVKGTNIELANPASPADKSGLTFTMTED